MPFDPLPGYTVQMDDINFRIAENPAGPGLPYGQEDRAAVVDQLENWADKVS